LLVSLGVLGLIAGLTIPSVVVSVENAKIKTSAKEAIQTMSQIVQEGILNGDFSNITNWSLDNPTDPIVAYFTKRLGSVSKQCLKDDLAYPCNLTFGGYALSSYDNHSARWILSNGTAIQFCGLYVNSGYILVSIQLKRSPNKQMDIVWNISETPTSPTPHNPSLVLKSGQAGPWHYAGQLAADSPSWNELYSN
jgi:type II secretory pathway pseudopilin PulG